MGKYKGSKMLRRIHDVFGLSAAQKDEIAAIAKVFPFQATEYYLSLIDWDDPDDPIRRIVIPDAQELEADDNEGSFDPCDEAANFVAPGVQHKYPHTALIVLTDVCGGLCRYCFRKRLFWDEAHDAHQGVDIAMPEVAHDVEPALDYIRNHREITNVLLTGGDPLSMPTARLAYVLSELRDMDHIGVIRIGTRMPVFNPQRILDDPELLRAICSVNTNQRRVYVVTHFDHPREITEEAVACVAELINNGVIMLNQHPILAGVNDDVDVLVELYRDLTRIGVATYYVFVTRPTLGNHSFQVPITQAYFIVDEAKKRLSGIDKRLRLVMSHASGKVSVVAVDDELIYLKYHRARHAGSEGKLMAFHRDDEACWLDDLEPAQLKTR
jgi:KamA family protein